MNKYLLKTKITRIPVPVKDIFDTKEEAEEAQKIRDRSPLTRWTTIEEIKEKDLSRLVCVAFFEKITEKPSTEERTKMWHRIEEKIRERFNQGVMIRSISIEVYNENGEIEKIKE